MLNRWVRHSARKVPLTVAGRFASSTDPATWATWSRASASTAGVGLGFALNGDGIVCLDLDHCLLDDRVAPWAASVLELCPGTYVEVSPSGSGLHIWGRASLGSGRVVKVPGGAVEIYGSGRYMTVTGQSFAGAPSRLGDLSTAVTALLG